MNGGCQCAAAGWFLQPCCCCNIMFFSYRRPEQGAMCFHTHTHTQGEADMHFTDCNTEITFIFNSHSYITCKTRMFAQEIAIKPLTQPEIKHQNEVRSSLLWIEAVNIEESDQTCYLSDVFFQHLCSFLVAVHLQVLEDEEEQSGVLLCGHAAAAVCPSGPTEPTGRREESSNIKLLTVQFMLAIQCAAMSLWRRPPRSAPWEVEFVF